MTEKLFFQGVNFLGSKILLIIKKKRNENTKCPLNSTSKYNVIIMMGNIAHFMQ